MKENYEFKNLGEMQAEMPGNKRPEDILIDRKSIFEYPKTPAQKEIIKTASRLVREHLEKLNIEQLKPFDGKRIVFLPQKSSMIAGEYHDGDFFTINETTEANLGTIVHELIHAESSEWRNYAEEEFEKFLEEKKQPAKSGFHRSATLKNINEGITEKITREIINDNLDEYAKLKPLFEGRMEQALAEQERKFQDEVLPQKIKEEEERVKEGEKSLEEFKMTRAKNIAELDQKILESKSEREKQFFIKMKKDEENYLEQDIKNTHQNAEIFDLAKHVYEKNDLKLQGIKEDYNFNPESMTSYDFNVEIINNLVEGIAKYNFKNDSSLNTEQEKEKVWKDLQEAYFHGRTVFLRKIDKIFGSGFLRKIDNIRQLISEKEKNDFINELKQRVASI